MTKIAKVSEFDNDVTEYRIMEKAVAKDFLTGVIKLGEILQRQRDKWKSQGKWLDYLEKVGKHISGANQFIRLYEYSVGNMKQLMDASLSNWNKVNMFLALPDEVKEQLGESIGGKEQTTDEFRETITEVDLPKPEIISEDKLPVLEKLDLKDMVISASTVDSFFMAKEMIKAFKKEGKDFSNYCIPVAVAYVELVKINNTLETEKVLGKLTSTEKRFWKKLLKSQVEAADKLLNK